MSAVSVSVVLVLMMVGVWWFLYWWCIKPSGHHAAMLRVQSRGTFRVQSGYRECTIEDTVGVQ